MSRENIKTDSLSLTLKTDYHLNKCIIKKYYNDEQSTTESWRATLTNIYQGTSTPSLITRGAGTCINPNRLHFFQDPISRLRGSATCLYNSRHAWSQQLNCQN